MTFVLLVFATAAFGTNFDYDRQWKEIDALLSKGLPLSAEAGLDAVLEASRQENNQAQQIKALVYKLRILQKREEFSGQKAIDAVNTQLQTASFPASAIMHSMLAQLYWSYSQNNLFRFGNRSETVNFQRDDVATWDLDTITKATLNEYLKSLERARELQAYQILDFAPILEKGNDRERLLRPTLYDFLAWSALGFFIRDDTSLTLPAQRFSLDDARYFGSAGSFATLSISSPDSLSFSYQVLRIYQDLIAFHLSDPDPAAYVEADLARLAFVHQKSKLSENYTLYENALRALMQRHSANEVYAMAAYELALLYQSTAVKWAFGTSEPHRWDFKIAAEICDEAAARFPRSYGAQACRSLSSQLRRPSLEIKCEDLIVPGTPVKALITLGNITKLELRIYRVPYIDIKTLHPNEIWEYRENENKKLYNLLKKKPLWSQLLEFEDEGDCRRHSRELALAKLPAGHYILIAGDINLASVDTPNFLGFSLFSCTRLATVYSINQGNLMLIADRDTGWPIASAKVKLCQDDSPKKESLMIWSGTSDPDGMVSIPSDLQYRYNKMEISAQADTLQIWRNAGTGVYTPPRNVPSCLLFTDRAIYRPGQTIYYKGVVYRSDGEKNTSLAPDAEVTVTFMDVNSQTIATQKLKANEYGSFSGSFIAPTGVLTGNMTIRAGVRIIHRLDDRIIADLSGSASISVSVEEYKRPRFEVKINSPTQTYALDQSVTITGKAISYAGFPIDNAQVAYRVYRQARYPHWFWWRGPMPSEPEMEILYGISTTDAKGEFSISFLARGDGEADPDQSLYYSFRINVDVTDISGETRSGASTLNVGTRELILSLDLDSQIDKSTGLLKVPVSSTNLNGSEVPADIKVSISKLQTPDRVTRSRLWSAPDRFQMSREEYLRLYPHDLYATEDKIDSWKELEQVWSGNFSTSKAKVLSIEDLTDWQPGAYKLEAITTYKGKEIREIRYFTLIDPSSSSLPYPQARMIAPVKVVCEPGQTAKVLFGTGYNNVRLIYEVEKNHTLTQREYITLNGEQRLFELPVTEADRGGFYMRFIFIKDGRFYYHNQEISVPWTDKQISFEYQTFRDKLLPGQQEEWRLKLKDHTGGRITAEVLASMYDASLDAFRASTWNASVWKKLPCTIGWSGGGFLSVIGLQMARNRYTYHYVEPRRYDTFNWFGYYLSYYTLNSKITMTAEKDRVGSSREIITESLADASVSDVAGIATMQAVVSQTESEPNPVDLTDVAARSNFAETAFFYPELRTDEHGEVSFAFTVPDALTRWKFRAFALTQDFKTGVTENLTVTQKPLMVLPNLPRFFREGDRIRVSAKITALEDKDLSGKCQLFLLDAFTGKPIDRLFDVRKAQKSFKVKQGQSTVLSWDLKIPDGLGAVTCRIVAKSGDFSDGEETLLPILSNRMLVTESLPLPVRGKSQRDFKFAKLVSSAVSRSIRHHRLTLEYTSNPSWYAVQALPYLMEYPHECNEQIFSRLYANSLASHIANSDPAIKRVFESWRDTPGSTALLSNLQKNEELKAVVLQETPWVLDARDEASAKQRIGQLFDLNNLRAQTSSANAKLQRNQSASGGWPWFSGMPDSWWVTQYIVEGFGHLDRLGVSSVRKDKQLWQSLQKAVGYIDGQLNEGYQWLKTHGLLAQNNLGYMQVHYLYARSFFFDIPIPAYAQEAVSYYWAQAEEYWLQRDFYSQGMLCLALYRKDNPKTANDIIASLREHALHDEELGMWWKVNSGWFWYQAPIERQALLIEAFSEVAKDTLAVNDLRVWLLKNKQTNNWKTTKATALACYALLLEGTQWLGSSQIAQITLGGTKLDPSAINGSRVEAGTGYFKTSWTGSDIKATMGEVSVANPNPGPSWGALYWQYFEDLDKITPAETPLKLKKQLFIEKTTDRGIVLDPIRDNNRIKVGDKVVVRIELRVDRDMEYLHMKDMRGAGFEPLNVLSRYKWQDGLGYYEATGDAATNFFIEHLPKGTYVFEYGMRAFQAGDFSNGITSIQCMYAPEFTAHSEGIRVKIE